MRGTKHLFFALGSPGMAVALLILLAAVCIIGTFIPQDRAPEFYHSKYPGAPGSIILITGLDHLYVTWWFILILAFIAINLFISNFRRAKRLIRERGGLSKWGSFITHLGLLVIFAGAIIGRIPFLNYSYYVEVDEGEQLEVKDRSFNLRLLSFNAKVNEKGFPLQYESKVKIEVPGAQQSSFESMISVNHPLHFKNIYVYQAACGIRSIDILVKREGRETILSFPLNPDGSPPEAIEKRFREMSDPPVILYVHNFFPQFIQQGEGIGTLSPYPVNPVARLFVKKGDRRSDMPLEEVGWLFLGKKVQKEGICYILKNVKQFSGFIVRNDSGMYVVWLGFFIALTGLFIFRGRRHM